MFIKHAPQAHVQARKVGEASDTEVEVENMISGLCQHLTEESSLAKGSIYALIREDRSHLSNTTRTEQNSKAWISFQGACDGFQLCRPLEETRKCREGMRWCQLCSFSGLRELSPCLL